MQLSTERDEPAGTVDLRPFMAGFPTGVAIVSTFDDEDRPWGMTCTSMCSVTLSPPTLLVCLRNGSPTLHALLTTGTFSVNLLADHARPDAALFASGAPDRFDRVAWHRPDSAGGPHLYRAAHAIADCRVDQHSLVGDHVMVLGEVTRTGYESASAPLLYGRREYAAWPVRERAA
jgi:flavin reductase (DIM6/NTAB) family NADH-FMN oxidoreductase RutF